MKPKQLHYFRCRYCTTVLVCAVRQAHPAKCQACRSWMNFLHSVDVTTPEQEALWSRGQVWNPHKYPAPSWTCVRCGYEKSGSPIERVDGKVCIHCYHAETRPETVLLTDEQIAEDRTRVDRLLDEDDERMEAAYRRIEQETK